MQTLRGRTCVFAGATVGDGPETVRALCKGGMNVAVFTHQPKAAKRLKHELEKLGFEGGFLICADGRRRRKTREELFSEVRDAFGSVDVIISNTGGDGKQDSLETLEPSALLHSKREPGAAADLHDDSRGVYGRHIREFFQRRR